MQVGAWALALFLSVKFLSVKSVKGVRQIKALIGAAAVGRVPDPDRHALRGRSWLAGQVFKRRALPEEPGAIRRHLQVFSRKRPPVTEPFLMPACSF